MVLLESVDVSLGTEAPEFSLKGTDEKIYSLNDFPDAKGFVIIFMCNHCPYVLAVWDRLVKLQESYKAQGIQLIGINSNLNPDYPEETFEKMKEYYDKYSMNFPYLQDPDQSVAKKYNAQCTPDIYMYDGEKKLVYHGRIDDNWQNENEVTSKELAGAIENLLAQKAPLEGQRPSMGCSIKWMN